MKKSLLATTALAALGAVAVAGSASAAEKIQVTVGGYMQQWFGFADSSKNVNRNNTGFDQKTDSEIHFKGVTTLDNGIKVGIHVELEGQTESGGAADQIDEQYLFVDGSFGRFLMGSENSASYLMHYSIPSHGATLDSGDITDWIAGGDFTGARTNGRGIDNDSEKLTYFTPRFSGFQLGVSYVPAQNQDLDGPQNTNDGVRDDGFSVAANFNQSFGDFKLLASAGYQHFGEDDAVAGSDLESYQFGLRLGFAGFTLAGTYGEEDRANAAQVFTDTQETYGLGLSYAAGPMGVSFAYIGSDRDRATDAHQDAFELGAKYALGPGVDLKGSVYYLEREAAGVDRAKGFAVVGGLDLSF
jgi:outer membrane protein OmpU